ncbi:MAG: TrmH family RNA methyltransferase [Moraxella sp.]|nr:TrmH family RNA methyltransferase [Moraxella sp.]
MTDTLDFLACIKVVMVETTLPANIGSAARAMMTAGLSNLTVVNPKLPIDDTSIAHAKGGLPVLQNARIVPTLADAVADCSLIFACSSRSRHLPRPVVTPHQAIEMIDNFIKNHTDNSQNLDSSNNSDNLNNPPSDLPKIALLFGREDRGLTNDELAIAHYHLQIHANPAYPVLNVASSIQVIGSFFYDYLIENKQKNDKTDTPLLTHIRTDWDEPAVSFADNDKLQKAVLDLFLQLNLANDDNLAHLPNRLTRLGNRVQLDKKEFALLMSLIHRIRKKLN